MGKTLDVESLASNNNLCPMSLRRFQYVFSGSAALSFTNEKAEYSQMKIEKVNRK
ncbi:MAG: hypothetical protein IPL95_13930 [Saprospiraceae bacterium]|nr:hypothetical protein [Saprospiraceae bacterium]